MMSEMTSTRTRRCGGAAAVADASGVDVMADMMVFLLLFPG